ncbi:hypothetical protein ABIC83_002456 [Roseateles asaccharophilus]|uniref:hypothetical protein n=1 Tax=Roseateles asaccharophilus TaxID=582607 RepID=UPI0038327F91
MKVRARKAVLMRLLSPVFISPGQALFEERNPWSIGSVVDWGHLTPEQRTSWELEASNPGAPEIPLEQLQFEPSGLSPAAA